MAISKQPDGKWLVQCFPNGRNGRRIRKQFATKGEAVAYERYIKEQAEDKPWLGEKIDRRSLLDLVETWYRSHGVTLNDGARRLSAMTFACEAMGSPAATEFTAKLFSAYREQRISGKLTRSDRVKKLPHAQSILNWLISVPCLMSCRVLMNGTVKTRYPKSAHTKQMNRKWHSCLMKKLSDCWLNVRIVRLRTYCRW